MSGQEMTGLISAVLALSIPIVAIVTYHFQRQTQTKRSMLQEEIELERLKHENFLLETEKLKIELEHRNLSKPSDKNKKWP